LNKVPQVVAVLHEERLVEAKLLADAFDRRRRCGTARDLTDRVCGQDVEQDEGDERDTE